MENIVPYLHGARKGKVRNSSYTGRCNKNARLKEDESEGIYIRN
jgi:hypothetical protein